MITAYDGSDGTALPLFYDSSYCIVLFPWFLVVFWIKHQKWKYY